MFPLDASNSGTICFNLSRSLELIPPKERPQTADVINSVLKLSEIAQICPGRPSEIDHFISILNENQLPGADQVEQCAAASELKSLALQWQAQRLSLTDGSFVAANDLDSALENCSNAKPPLNAIHSALQSLLFQTPLQVPLRDRLDLFYDRHYPKNVRDLTANKFVLTFFIGDCTAAALARNPISNRIGYRLLLNAECGKSLQKLRRLGVKNLSDQAMQFLDSRINVEADPVNQFGELSAYLEFFRNLQFLREMHQNAVSDLRKFSQIVDKVEANIALFDRFQEMDHPEQNLWRVCNEHSSLRQKSLSALGCFGRDVLHPEALSAMQSLKEEIRQTHLALENLMPVLIQNGSLAATYPDSGAAETRDTRELLKKLSQTYLRNSARNTMIEQLTAYTHLSNLTILTRDFLPSFKAVSSEACEFFATFLPPKDITGIGPYYFAKRVRPKSNPSEICKMAAVAMARASSYFMTSARIQEQIEGSIQTKLQCLKIKVPGDFSEHIETSSELMKTNREHFRRLLTPFWPTSGVASAFNAISLPALPKSPMGTLPLSPADWASSPPKCLQQPINYRMSELIYDSNLLEEWALDQRSATSPSLAVQYGMEVSKSEEGIGQFPLADIYYRRGTKTSLKTLNDEEVDAYFIQATLWRGKERTNWVIVWALDRSGVCFFRTRVPYPKMITESCGVIQKQLELIRECANSRISNHRLGHKMEWPCEIEANGTVDEQMGVVQLRIPGHDELGVLQLYFSETWDMESNILQNPQHQDKVTENRLRFNEMFQALPTT